MVALGKCYAHTRACARVSGRVASGRFGRNAAQCEAVVCPRHRWLRKTRPAADERVNRRARATKTGAGWARPLLLPARREPTREIARTATPCARPGRVSGGYQYTVTPCPFFIYHTGPYISRSALPASLRFSTHTRHADAPSTVSSTHSHREWSVSVHSEPQFSSHRQETSTAPTHSCIRCNGHRRSQLLSPVGPSLTRGLEGRY